MKLRSSNMLVLQVTIVFSIFLAESTYTYAQVCTCSGDIVGTLIGGCWTPPDGVHSSNDIVAIVKEVEDKGSQRYCDGRSIFDHFDINCDGLINFCDVDIVVCEGTARDGSCCQTVICGACCINSTTCTESTQSTCENNQQGAYLGDGTGCSVASCFLNPVITVLPPLDVTKDRYLSLNPNNFIPMAIRVTRVGSTTPWYVSCTLQDAGIDGKLGQLVPTAEFCIWTDSVIHVRGCEIVPGNEYLIEATNDDLSFSTPLSIFTTTPQISGNRQFGDVVGAWGGE